MADPAIPMWAGPVGYPHKPPPPPMVISATCVAFGRFIPGVVLRPSELHSEVPRSTPVWPTQPSPDRLRPCAAPAAKAGHGISILRRIYGAGYMGAPRKGAGGPTMPSPTRYALIGYPRQPVLQSNARNWSARFLAAAIRKPRSLPVRIKRMPIWTLRSMTSACATPPMPGHLR